MALVTGQRPSRAPRPIYLTTFLTLVAALLAALLVSPDSASAAGVSDVRTVHTNQETEGDGPRVPDIISTSANNAVVAWREGTLPGRVDEGYIRYSYTTDGGAKWSHPKVLAQETSEYLWHYVTLYQVGDELFAYLGRTPVLDDSETDGDGNNDNGLPINDIVVKRSTDQGHTWQDYAVDMPLDDPATAADEGLGNLAFAGRPLQLANGDHVMPYWASGRENGVLYSTDLKKWVARPAIPDPNKYMGGEPQLTVSQDDPNKLVMVARSNYAVSKVSAVTATSADGGLSWTDWALDSNVPSNDSKVFFTTDSAGRYLTIANTSLDASAYRKVLNYKVKSPGKAWRAAKLFADGPADDPTPAGTGAGWDTYPMADEYAPGKFFVVWEHDTSAIKVSRLDISDT
ncbi:sialidase family protein [Streptomyces sp. NPDC050597]|uniref:sialidase family protein n=1 Tax=Streptomyces sp. NPDC050597 TaxID=3157212 RepID=UPI00343B844B